MMRKKKIIHTICFTAKETAEFLEQEIDARPRGNQLLVKNHFDLVSAGTELANYRGLPNTMGAEGFPVWPGYSASGVVEAVGPEVTRFKKGDRVVCTELGHRSWWLGEESHFFPVPDEAEPEEAAAAFVCAFAFLGVRKLRLQMGEAVMIAGLGLLGQFAVQIARCAGAAPVLACDFSPARRALALELGADAVLDPADPDFIERVKSLTDGRGPEGVVEVTGHLAALQQALCYVAWQGRISLLGCTRISDRPVDFYRYVHRRGITLIGSHTQTRPRWESREGEWTVPDDFRTFFRYVGSGRLRVKPIIPHMASPRDAGALYRKLALEKDPPLGILLDWRSTD